MKFSLQWLREHVAVDGSARALAERLTAAGHALDGMEEAGGDAILDLDITTNRADCLSVRGLAREVGALLRRPLADLGPSLAVEERGAPIEGEVTLANQVPDLCRRFVLRVVRGVRVAASPAWLADRLRLAGLRPINNLVDATNYVMLELGHPLHAFDLRALRGRRAEIRLARAGERLRTLDGAERRLEDWMIVVADAERAVSLAGVMGGQETEIGEATTDVLLEAAWWDPVTIYRTARALGLQTDASYRFERRADPEACAAAVDRCARILQDVAGGSVAPGMLDSYPGRRPPAGTSLRPARAAALLGFDLPLAEARDVLVRFGFAVEGDDAAWRVDIPSYRGDVTSEVDLIEEVARGLGFERIPETMPVVVSDERGLAPWQRRLRRIRRVLEAGGFFEAINPSFVSREEEAPFSPYPGPPLALANPMSEKGEVLRTALLPSLVRNAALNVHHGQERVRLFEIARTFRPRAAGELPEERLHLALIALGPAGPTHWQRGGDPEAGLYDVKGMLEAIGAEQGVALPEVTESGPSYLEAGAAATWRVAGRDVAWFGVLAAAAAAPFELERAAGVAEIDLSALLGAPRDAVRFRPLPRHPGIVRDLSLVLPAGRRYREIEEAIRTAGGSLVAEVLPFDHYRGKGLPGGGVAIGVRIRFQHPERTLVSGEVDALQVEIVQALARLDVHLRA